MKKANRILKLETDLENLRVIYKGASKGYKKLIEKEARSIKGELKALKGIRKNKKIEKTMTISLFD